MAHAHAHGHGGSRRALALAFGLTLAYALAQLAGGVAFGSLTLLGDAAHNASDAAAIGIAALAAWFASRPPSPRRTFGWARLEILAALVNGLVLCLLAVWIFWQGLDRLRSPHAVDGGGVLVVGLVGIGVNALAAWVLWRGGDRHDLNLRAALQHTVVDVAGSATAAATGLVVLATGWVRADAIAGMALGVLVLVTSWRLVSRPLAILIEAVPPGISVERVGTRIASVEGVKSVHDLHVWTITSDMVALSAHVVTQADAEHDAILHAVQELLLREFGIDHATIQVDRDHGTELLTIHRVGCPEGPRARTAPVASEHAHPHAS